MATGAAIGAAVLTGGPEIYGGLQARKAAKKQQKILDEQARLERSAAAFDAAQASRDFDRLIGTQKARIAGSGIELVGSPMDILEQTERDKQDTINNILAAGAARASALQAEAGLVRDAGRAALTASIIRGISSSAKGLASAAQSFGSAGGGKQIAGGAGGAKAGAAAAAACDIRLKKDIKRIGKLDNGLPIYLFRYKDDPDNKLHVNVMAQDVEKVMPDAIVEVDGYKHVILDKIGGAIQCQ